VTDRIKKPWGERTPFGAGETWPVRVDQFLEEGVSEAEIDHWVQTAAIAALQRRPEEDVRAPPYTRTTPARPARRVPWSDG
jgi:hypothetical protein